MASRAPAPRTKTPSKRPPKVTRRAKEESGELSENAGHIPGEGSVRQRPSAVIEPATENQRRYLAAMKAQTLTMGIGPAGTGKTFLAAAFAAQLLAQGQVEKIIVSRPAVEAGESLGFLPGELEEKFEPYLAPFRAALEECLGKGPVSYMLKSGKIEAAPLAYLRGRSFHRSFVILDEAQNTSPLQMKMFLTRIGRDAKVVINGDVEQIDITGESGLVDAERRIHSVPGVKIIRFDMNDVVRSDFCSHIVRAYSTNPTNPAKPASRREGYLLTQG